MKRWSRGTISHRHAIIFHVKGPNLDKEVQQIVTEGKRRKRWVPYARRCPAESRTRDRLNAVVVTNTATRSSNKAKTAPAAFEPNEVELSQPHQTQRAISLINRLGKITVKILAMLICFFLAQRGRFQASLSPLWGHLVMASAGKRALGGISLAQLWLMTGLVQRVLPVARHLASFPPTAL